MPLTVLLARFVPALALATMLAALAQPPGSPLRGTVAPSSPGVLTGQITGPVLADGGGAA
jgi:hypothetical protein